jgi:hypothetical protein
MRCCGRYKPCSPRSKDVRPFRGVNCQAHPAEPRERTLRVVVGPPSFRTYATVQMIGASRGWYREASPFFRSNTSLSQHTTAERHRMHIAALKLARRLPSRAMLACGMTIQEGREMRETTAQVDRDRDRPSWRQRLRTHIVNRGIQVMCGSTVDVSAAAAGLAAWLG